MILPSHEFAARLRQLQEERSARIPLTAVREGIDQI